MKVIGIVAEYNPFHNGHAYQIAYAREVLKADYIIIAMSGPFTQRGDIACFDKYSRAQMALENGADIVLEIPVIFTVSSAREYASCGVRLLAATGLVDTILFGAETSDSSLFKESAEKILKISQTEAFNHYIAAEVRQGISYAKARSDYLREYIPSELMTSSNNILGLEYSLAIAEAGIDMSIECLQRKGNAYNESKLTGSFSSATAIRQAISENRPVTGLPECVRRIIKNKPFVCQEDLSLLLHYKLLNQNDFTLFLDCNREVSDRINKYKKDFSSVGQFCDVLKTKNYTYTRINRILTHILLDIMAEDFATAKSAGYVSYLRMLGFSKKGKELLPYLKKAPLPLLTAPNDLTSHYDIKAADIYNMVVTQKTGLPQPNEYSRKFTLANI